MAVSTDLTDPESLSEQDLKQFEDWSGQDIISWAFETFGDDAAIGTSLQHTGMTQIDLASRETKGFRVFTVDTLRFHDETYEFIESVQEHYDMNLEIYKPDPEEVQDMIDRHGEYLFFDSREKQQLCCDIRKSHPHDRAVQTVDVWICGLRRDQSDERSEVPKAQFTREAGKKVLKLAPLADWTEDEIWNYIEENNVPYNPLFDEGYKTISCRICTTPVQDDEDKRDGRWRWFNNHDRECGLHYSEGGGI
ncbi:MAG: phosphoadenylyl-sulfate reductase [bacterium]